MSWGKEFQNNLIQWLFLTFHSHIGGCGLKAVVSLSWRTRWLWFKVWCVVNMMKCCLLFWWSLVMDMVKIEIVLWFSHHPGYWACQRKVQHVCHGSKRGLFSVLVERNPKTKISWWGHNMLPQILSARFFVETFEAHTALWQYAMPRPPVNKETKTNQNCWRIENYIKKSWKKNWRVAFNERFFRGRFSQMNICSPKTPFFALKVTLPPAKDCFWEETKTNRVHFPPPSICCWLFTWNNNEKEHNQIKVGKEQKGKYKRETNKQWTFSAKLSFSWACELMPIKRWSKQNSTVFFKLSWKGAWLADRRQWRSSKCHLTQHWIHGKHWNIFLWRAFQARAALRRLSVNWSETFWCQDMIFHHM